MFFSWEEKAYRSKHVDLCVIKVKETHELDIVHLYTGQICYFVNLGFPFHKKERFIEAEGFDSEEDMDNWFRKSIPQGTTQTMHLIIFEPI